MGVEIRSDEITPYLERLEPGPLGQFLGRARERVGDATAEAVRTAYGSSSFPFSKTGNLRASIGWRRMKSEQVVGFVAGPMRGRGAKGYHRALVEAGTKPHRIRTPAEVLANVPKDQGSILHPGATANPWVTRNKPGIIARAQEEFDKAVKEELT